MSATWVDRLGAGIADTDRVMSAADGERIIRLVAHHVGAEVHPGAPRVSAELPEGGASLRTAGRPADRTAVLIDVLAAVAETYRRWLAGVDVAQEYVGLSATLGRDVRADLGDRLVIGHAVRLGPSGELVVVDAGGGGLGAWG